MDILTQGLLGGVLAQSVARQGEKKLATLAGAFAGLLADADVLIRSSEDPLLVLEYHRHFTHSLLFVPLGAALAALLLWPLLHRHLPGRRIYLFCLAGYGLSGVLDALTSYGTSLFWPFFEQRIALNLIAVVDPVFTLLLLLSLLLGLHLPHRPIARSGLLLCLCYLGLALLQQQRADKEITALIAQRDHHPVRQVIKPTLGNILLWRSVYENKGRLYVDAVRVGLFSGVRVYPGDSVSRFDPDEDMRKYTLSDTRLADIQRFVRFSDGYAAFDPNQPGVLGDIRYSMLPHSVSPLWGIAIHPTGSRQHVTLRFFRDAGPQVRETFMNMLLGQ